MIKVLSILLVVVIVIFVYLYKKIKESIAKKEDIRYTVKLKKSVLYEIYLRLSKYRLTRRYINKIQKKYEIYEMNSKKEVGIKVAKTVLKIWGLSLIMIIISVIISRSWVMFLVVTTMIYIINTWVLYSDIDNSDIKFMNLFSAYLDSISHHFYKYKSVVFTLDESIIMVKEPIRCHIERIIKILNTPGKMDEEITRYNGIAPNIYIKEFLSLCEIVQRRGDQIVNGESQFISNIMRIQENMNKEINNRVKQKHKLAGLTALAVIPMYLLVAIKNWAIGKVPELINYYTSMYGVCLFIFIFLVSIVVFNILNTLKYKNRFIQREYPLLKKILKLQVVEKGIGNYVFNNYGKALRSKKLINEVGETLTVNEYYLERILCSVVTFLVCITVSLSVHQYRKENLTTYVNNIVSISNEEEQVKQVKDTVINYTNKYKGRNVSVEEIQDKLVADGVIRNKVIMTTTAEEIVKRVRKYNNEYFKWYELLTCIGIALMAYHIPYLMLLYKKSIRKMYMQDEVITYQFIICMLMYIERISVKEILEYMEAYSHIFKKSLGDCINNYSAGTIKALEILKENEEFEPFKKIVDNLIMCDSVGIERAFGEISSSQRIYQEKRQIENDSLIDTKTTVGVVISWMPFLLAFLFYLIIPFLTESLSQYINYSNEINNII